MSFSLRWEANEDRISPRAFLVADLLDAIEPVVELDRTLKHLALKVSHHQVDSGGKVPQLVPSWRASVLAVQGPSEKPSDLPRNLLSKSPGKLSATCRGFGAGW